MLPIITGFENDTYYVYLTDKKSQKTFIGKCKLHEEDKENKSSFFGYEIAELRAYIKYYKYHIKELQLKQKGISIFINKFSNNKNFNSNGYIERKLKKEFYLYQKEINTLKNYISITEGNILGKLKVMDKMK